MWGAIIGDLAGSIYEFNQLKQVYPLNDIKKVIASNSFYSDDTILTIAILDAILNDNNYEKYLKIYGNRFIDYKPNFHPYFKTSFSPSFIKWVTNNYIGESSGNGAMMRISPIGYLFNSEDDIRKNVYFATNPSHNTKEAIDSATIIAMIIFLARKGFNKKQIIKYLNIKLKYTPFQKFNTTCDETIGNCLYALFMSNSFNDSILKVLSYGGDTDTNACIVGSMAEALYGINDCLIEQAKSKIPQDFVKKLEIGYQKIKK